MKAPDLKAGQMMTILYIVGVIVLLFIVYKALQKIGLVTSKEKRLAEAEKAEAITDLRTDEYFHPDYYKGKSFKSLGSNMAEQLATEIRKSVRGFGTNEEQINISFGKCYNKTNISEISEQYYQKYGNDLQEDLLNDLSEKEVVNMMNVINGLPLK